jgi:hypothetical protein
MSTQTYANHAHQPVATLVGTAFWAVTLVGVVASARDISWGPTLAWAGLLLCLFTLLLIGRTYTTALQDRIILLEERFRATSLLTPGQIARWHELSPKQVVALRFASDAEWPALVDRALTERLTPKAIKQAVRDWRPDLRRT